MASDLEERVDPSDMLSILHRSRIAVVNLRTVTLYASTCVNFSARGPEPSSLEPKVCASSVRELEAWLRRGERPCRRAEAPTWRESTCSTESRLDLLYRKQTGHLMGPS